MVKKRRKFTKEFKMDAVRLALESDRTVSDVARDLGISPTLLHKWTQLVEEKAPEAVFPGSGKLSGEDDEMRRLRAELAQVKQENEFLKKAAVFFARESP